MDEELFIESGPQYNYAPMKKMSLSLCKNRERAYLQINAESLNFSK